MIIMHKFLTMAILVILPMTVQFSSAKTYSPGLLKERRKYSTNYRLPDKIIPTSYHITISADIDSEIFKFSGESKININIKTSTNKITLHAKYLEIDPNVELNCDDSRRNVNIVTVKRIDPVLDFLVIIVAKKLMAGSNCNLILKYSGKSGNEYEGFYRTSYISPNGKQKWMATTHFQPIAARQAFPCWDEPALKANFTISLKHKINHYAISNMQPQGYETHQDNPEFMTTHFAESPKMSTYSVAFVIGDIVRVDNDDNQEFIVSAPENGLENGKYAMEFGKKLMRTLEIYTDFPYKSHGLTQMVSIALPLKSNISAMENWGLVIYQPQYLLLDENSIVNRERVAVTMAHELAHQWFGNLVTASWYDYMWLNEGLANYLQYAIIDQIEPTWRMMDRFVSESLQSNAFMHDSEMNSEAIEHERNTPEDFENVFNDLYYDKSGCVIRMISNILGEETFKIGLQNYLKHNAFGSVTSDNLFEEWAKVSTHNIELREILKNWVTLPGYPVINVKRNYTTQTAIITQSRFLETIDVSSTEKYWIPITFVTEDNLDFTNTNVTHWLDPSSESIKLNGLKNHQFVILNKQMFGYYRVNYDKKNWKLIINYLKSGSHTNIHVLNRAQLIDDALNLARAGHLKYNVILSLIEYLKNETDYIVWSAAWNAIKHMYELVADTVFEKYFKHYVHELSANLIREVESIQLGNADHITRLKKNEALKWACFFGLNEYRIKAKEELAKWLDNPNINIISPDEKRWVLYGGLWNADQKLLDKLWNVPEYGNDLDGIYFPAFTCTLEIKFLMKILINAIAIEPTFDRLHITVMTICENNIKYGPNTVLDFIIGHYNKIITLDGYNNDHLYEILIYLGGSLKSEEQHYKLKAFIRNNEISLNSIADDAISTIEHNSIIVKARLREFKNFFYNPQFNHQYLSHFNDFLNTNVSEVNIHGN